MCPSSGPHFPPAFWGEGLAAAGVVNAVVREPEDRRLERRGRRARLVGRRDHPVKATGANVVDLAGGHPVPFVVTAYQHVARPHRRTIGGPKARAQHSKAATVVAHLQHRPLVVALDVRRPRRAFAVVEVPFGIRLQVETELVVVRGDLSVVVEVLVEVCLPVLVEVPQPGDLVAPDDIDGVVQHLEPQRLKKPRGETLPSQMLELLI